MGHSKREYTHSRAYAPETKRYIHVMNLLQNETKLIQRCNQMRHRRGAVALRAFPLLD
jgi:hypothetical protein